MIIMCCCTKTKFIGCVNACGDTIVVQASTDYTTLNLEVGSTVKKIAGTAVDGGLEFATQALKVGYNYRFWVTKADGIKYLDNQGFDCFSIDAINFYS